MFTKLFFLQNRYIGQTITFKLKLIFTISQYIIKQQDNTKNSIKNVEKTLTLGSNYKQNATSKKRQF